MISHNKKRERVGDKNSKRGARKLGGGTKKHMFLKKENNNIRI